MPTRYSQYDGFVEDWPGSGKRDDNVDGLKNLL